MADLHRLPDLLENGVEAEPKPLALSCAPTRHDLMLFGVTHTRVSKTPKTAENIALEGRARFVVESQGSPDAEAQCG
jgi:hypothetical protein